MEAQMRNLLSIVLLFLAMMVVELRGDEGRNNNTAHSQVNLTTSDHAKLNNEPASQTSYTAAVVTYNKNRYGGRGGGGGGGGGGSYRWGWGGGGGGGVGGGGGGGGGGWGWGSGGGGGGWYKWGCGGKRGVNNHQKHRKRVTSNEDYKVGEFAQCMGRGRCRGMRLDCPLHCGGPCFYDCQHMCKAHCRRS